MKHTATTDAIVDKLLASMDEDELADIIAAVPGFLSKPLDEAEHLAWIEYTADLHDDFPASEAVAEVVAIYAVTVGGTTVGETHFEVPVTVNFVKQATSGKCAAMRCKSDSDSDENIGGRTLPVCARHREECLHAGQIAPAGTDAEPSYQAELATETDQAKADLASIEDFDIATQDDMELAAAILGEAKGRANRLAERMKEITAPMRKAEASVRDLFRPAIDALTSIERIVKGKIAEAHKREAEVNAAALEAAARAHAEGDESATGAALSQVVHVGNVAGVQTRKVWKFEIVDAALVPREYLAVDEKAIRAAGHEEEIPGIRWYEDVGIAASAR